MTKWEYISQQMRVNSLLFTLSMFEVVQRRPFEIAPHHRAICDKLDEVLSGRHPTNRVIFNIPPRHSKTELAVISFAALGFGINPRSEFMHLSASDDLITRNVENIRRIMTSPEYRMIFPDTRIANNAKGSIMTEQGGVLYAAPFMGQITGFGCGKLNSDTFAGAMIIDDPMKAQDNFSATIKEKINRLWSSTLHSRRNDTRTPVIVTAQRLAEDDFSGHLIATEGTVESGGLWDVVKFPAILDEGTESERALWELRNPLAYLQAQRDSDNEMVRWDFQTQYMQNPMTLEGLMFPDFKTYAERPATIVKRANYTDTADAGEDYLCSICYEVGRDGNIYVIDILYTSEPMEITEGATASMLKRNQVVTAYIESNNGGRGFARTIARLATQTTIEWFHQSGNKEARIMTASAAIMQSVLMPVDWKLRWPEFHRHITTYQRKFRANKLDDAADVLAGIVEREIFKRGGNIKAFGFTN